jgi:hypothetical protein
MNRVRALCANATGARMITDKPHHSASLELLLIGLLAIAMGALAMLAVSGLLPAKSADAPLWLGVAGGMIFVFAGGALVLRWFAGGNAQDSELPDGSPRWLRASYSLIGLACIGLLAAIGTWVAFGPGERAFTMSIPYGGSGPGNPTIGRIAFGVGALVSWLFFILAARSSWRKLMK